MIRLLKAYLLIHLIFIGNAALAQDDGGDFPVDDGGSVPPPPENMPPPPPLPPPPMPVDPGGGDFDSDGIEPSPADPRGGNPGGVPGMQNNNPGTIEFNNGGEGGGEPSYSGRDLDIDGNVESSSPDIIGKGNATQDEEKAPPVTPDDVQKLQKAMDEKSFPKGGVKAVAKEEPAPERIFGSYRLHVGVAKPTFNDIGKYKDFYGETRFMPTIGVDYFFWDWFMTFGLTFRMAYYKDDGYAASGEVREKTNGTVETDHEAPTELTVIPLQVGIAFQATPFPAKWLVLSGWFGAEALYYQEYRTTKPSSSSTSDSGSTTTTTTSSRLGMASSIMLADDTTTDSSTTADSSDTTSSKSYLSAGWQYGTTMGISLSFLLNGLDQKSTKSLRSMNMAGVYLSPYLEITQNLSAQKLSFSRTVMGVAFTFETY